MTKLVIATVLSGVWAVGPAFADGPSSPNAIRLNGKWGNQFTAAPIASSGVRKPDFLSALDGLVPGASMFARTNAPDCPGGPICREIMDGAFVEPGDALVTWLEGPPLNIPATGTGSIAQAFTNAGAVVSGSGQTVQLVMPTLAQIGGLGAANNLSDLASALSARANLGLGGAAVLNVGGVTGTVAAGDDARFADSGATIRQYGGSPGASAAANCAAFTAAGASGLRVRVPAGNYQTSCTATIGTTNGGGLVGDGSKATTITNTTANMPTFKFADNASSPTLRGMTLVRSVTGTAGGAGLDTGNLTYNGLVDDVIAYGNYEGFILRSTARGTFRDCIAELSVSDGFDISNTPTLGTSGSPVQWGFVNTLSQSNGGWGYDFHANAAVGVYAITLIEMPGLQTFANGLGGVKFQGNPTTGIADIVLSGGFFGTDQGPEIYIDAYADNRSTIIRHVTAEINTTGNSIHVTANNDSVTISDPQVNVPPEGYAGIYSAALHTSISNPKVIGSGSPSTTAIGIRLDGNYSQIMGGRANSLGTGAMINGSNSSLIFVDLSGNATHARQYLSGTTEQSIGAASQTPP